MSLLMTSSWSANFHSVCPKKQKIVLWFLEAGRPCYKCQASQPLMKPLFKAQGWPHLLVYVISKYLSFFWENLEIFLSPQVSFNLCIPGERKCSLMAIIHINTRGPSYEYTLSPGTLKPHLKYHCYVRIHIFTVRLVWGFLDLFYFSDL